MKTEKLELRHLAPYLPHRLDMINEKSGRVVTMDALQKLEGDNDLAIGAGNGKWYGLDIWPFKPLLIPLSELTDEQWIKIFKVGCLNAVPPITNNYLEGCTIEHHDMGREVVLKGRRSISYYWPEVSFASDIRFNQLAAFNKLYELHADLHGLIDSGLATNKLNHPH